MESEDITYYVPNSVYLSNTQANTLQQYNINIGTIINIL